jgi:transcription elongation factor SPT6
LVYAEQFADPDLEKALAPEELLRRARMILATELGKDPLLRQEIRDVFKEHSLITVTPTEKGKVKIHLEDRYHVSSLLFHSLSSKQLITLHRVSNI